MTTVPFTKGHGTQNDFVLVPDLDGTRPLTTDEVRLLADRHAGLGGDGVIRVVRTLHATEPAVRAQAGDAAWFMDYHNADGSPAEMCGNGSRVFAAYLRREGLVDDDAYRIATRGGTKSMTVTGEQYAVDLGPWRVVDPAGARERGFDSTVRARGGIELPALRLNLGNPHTVVILPPEIDLDDLDLTEPPAVSPHPPEGTNVEFVRPIGQGHIAMRVHERGVGETRSCGTGAAAAALATRWWEGETEDNTDWVVDVPGGRVSVRALSGGHVELAGPAVLVADGTVTLPG
jgi:diaminopimelate epimerase